MKALSTPFDRAELSNSSAFAGLEESLVAVSDRVVSRAARSSATPLAMTPNFAGNTLSTAQVITVGPTTTRYQDFVGAADPNDYYRFTLSDTRNFSLSLSGLSGDADVQLLNSTGAFIVGSAAAGSTAESINRQLGAGTYYIRVFPFLSSVNTNYSLSVSAVPLDFAGNTLSTARAITVGPTATTYQDFVGTADTNDYYRFTLSDTRNFSLSMSGLSADADVQLLNSTGGFITSSAAGGTTAESITQQLSAGTYYIRVFPFTSSVNTSYSLSVSAAPTDLAGNTLSAARVIAVGSTATTYQDFVGAADTNDYYRFALTDTRNFSLSLSGLSGDADVQLLNSTGGLITSSAASGTTSESIARQLTAGTYYIRVFPFTTSVNTNYSLTVSAATGTTTATDPTVGTFAATGVNAIDSLFFPSRNFWNTSANGGNITYSFYRNTSGAYYDTELVSEVNDVIKSSVRNILATLSTVINVNFVEVADTATNFGVLRYMFSNGDNAPDFYAYAYSPGTSRISGDVHLNASAESGSSRFSGGVGSYGFATLIHETLHALGLKHPGNYNGGGAGTGPFLPGGEDNNTNSIMTYNDVGGNSTTAMAYDIRALQHIYGARSYNAAANTYAFSSVNRYTVNGQTFGATINSKQSVWDSGGIDTFDFSGLTTTSSYRFDLRQGGILTTQSAFNTSSYSDRSGTGTYLTSGFGTTIAFNTVIENLVNSRASDFIIANSAANTFSGYTLGTSTGNDIYEGTGSTDVLDLSSYSLTNLTASLSSGNLTIGLGTGGSIQVRNYFGSSGSMRVKIGSNFYRYSSTGGWQAAPTA